MAAQTQKEPVLQGVMPGGLTALSRSSCEGGLVGSHPTVGLVESNHGNAVDVVHSSFNVSSLPISYPLSTLQDRRQPKFLEYFNLLPLTIANLEHNRSSLSDIWRFINPIVYTSQTRRLRGNTVVDILLILPFEIDLVVYISSYLSANDWFRAFSIGDNFGHLSFGGNPVIKSPIMRIGHTADPDVVQSFEEHVFENRRHSVFKVVGESPLGLIYPCMCSNVSSVVSSLGTHIRDLIAADVKYHLILRCVNAPFARHTNTRLIVLPVCEDIGLEILSFLEAADLIPLFSKTCRECLMVRSGSMNLDCFLSSPLRIGSGDDEIIPAECCGADEAIKQTSCHATHLRSFNKPRPKTRQQISVSLLRSGVEQNPGPDFNSFYVIPGHPHTRVETFTIKGLTITHHIGVAFHSPHTNRRIPRFVFGRRGRGVAGKIEVDVGRTKLVRSKLGKYLAWCDCPISARVMADIKQRVFAKGLTIVMEKSNYIKKTFEHTFQSEESFWENLLVVVSVDCPCGHNFADIESRAEFPDLEISEHQERTRLQNSEAADWERLLHKSRVSRREITQHAETVRRMLVTEDCVRRTISNDWMKTWNSLFHNVKFVQPKPRTFDSQAEMVFDKSFIAKMRNPTIQVVEDELEQRKKVNLAQERGLRHLAESSCLQFDELDQRRSIANQYDQDNHNLFLDFSTQKKRIVMHQDFMMRVERRNRPIDASRIVECESFSRFKIESQWSSKLPKLLRSWRKRFYRVTEYLDARIVDNRKIGSLIRDEEVSRTILQLDHNADCMSFSDELHRLNETNTFFQLESDQRKKIADLAIEPTVIANWLCMFHRLKLVQMSRAYTHFIGRFRSSKGFTIRFVSSVLVDAIRRKRKFIAEDSHCAIVSATCISAPPAKPLKIDWGCLKRSSFNFEYREEVERWKINLERVNEFESVSKQFENESRAFPAIKLGSYRGPGEIINIEHDGYQDFSVANKTGGGCFNILSHMLSRDKQDKHSISTQEVFSLLSGSDYNITFVSDEKRFCASLTNSTREDFALALHLDKDGAVFHVSCHIITDFLKYRTQFQKKQSFLGMSFFPVDGVAGFRELLARHNGSYSDQNLHRHMNIGGHFTYNRHHLQLPVNHNSRGFVDLIRGLFKRADPHPSTALDCVDTPPPPGALMFQHFANCHCVLRERPTKFKPCFPSLHPYSAILDSTRKGLSDPARNFRCNCFNTHLDNLLNTGYTVCARVWPMTFVEKGEKNTFFGGDAENRSQLFVETTVSVPQAHIGALLKVSKMVSNAVQGSDMVINTSHATVAATDFAAAHTAQGPAQIPASAKALASCGTLDSKYLDMALKTYSQVSNLDRKVPGTFSDQGNGTLEPETVNLITPFVFDNVFNTRVAGINTPDKVQCMHTSRKSNFCTACMNSKLCARCGRCISRFVAPGLESVRRCVKAYCGFCDEGDPIVKAWKTIRDDTSTTITVPLGVYPMIPVTFSRTDAHKQSTIDNRAIVRVLTQYEALKQPGPQTGGICPTSISPICTVLDTTNMYCSLSSRQLATQGATDRNRVRSYLNYCHKQADDVCLNLNLLGYINGTVSPLRLSIFLKRYDPNKRQRYFDACSFMMSKEDHAKLGREVGCVVRPPSTKDVKNSIKDLFQRSIFLKNELLNKKTTPYDKEDNAGRIITSCTSPIPNVVLGPWVAGLQSCLKRLWSLEGLEKQTSRVKVLFACGRDCDDLGDMYAYCMNNFCFLTGLDYKKYDSNQKAEHHEAEGCLYRAAGFGSAAMKVFAAQSRNRATASVKGEKVIAASWRWRRNSGDPNTTLGNSWLNVTMLTWAIEQFCDLNGVDPKEFLVLIGGDDAMIASNIPPSVWQPFVDQLISVDLAMPLVWQINENPWCIRFMGALPYPTEIGSIRTGPCFERFISKIGYICNPTPDIKGWLSGVAKCWMSSFQHVPFIPPFCEPMLRAADGATPNYKKDGFLYAQSTSNDVVGPHPTLSMQVFQSQLLDIGIDASEALILDLFDTLRGIQSLPCLVSHPILNLAGQVSYDA